MTITTRQDSRLPEPASNEAAARLRDVLRGGGDPISAQTLLDRALAAERRATVERIRERLDEVDWMKPRTLRAILDEEAAR